MARKVAEMQFKKRLENQQQKELLRRAKQLKSKNTVTLLNIRTWKIAVIILKFKQCGSAVEKYIQKMQMECKQCMVYSVCPGLCKTWSKDHYSSSTQTGHLRVLKTNLAFLEAFDTSCFLLVLLNKI